MIDLKCGDCLELMQNLEDKSIDLILCDLPYGKTSCKWDNLIRFDLLWEQYKRIIKDNGCICLFGTEPFSSYLRLSNIDWYKYDLYWVKEKPTNFLQLKKRFGKVTENICVFYNKQCTYNPQKFKVNYRVINKPKIKNNSSEVAAKGFKNIKPYKDDGTRYPTDILKFNREKLGTTVHEAQKPVALLEYLIKSYTNEGDTVLDNCMGSGSTGVACINSNRDFIGIEINEDYFNIAKTRCEEHLNAYKK
jgi:site-specific DNA-methyltransferase (adenine-specific)